MKTDALIAVAGWEDRFRLGIERDLDSYKPNELFILAFEEYLDRTARQRAQVEELASTRGIRHEEVRVNRSEPVGVWRAIRSKFSVPIQEDRTTLVDISTMPREVIWWVFAALEDAGGAISYVYHRPGEYASGWVTRDTERPRLVYQRSGISDFSKETCLLIISGFDADRAIQLIQFFEPKKILFGLQTGHQYQNQTSNVERNVAAIGKPSNLHLQQFEIDAYSTDHGLQAMEYAIADSVSEFNIVAASLGPKLSAVALHQLARRNEDLALAYAATRQINPEYSRGIGDAVFGRLATSRE